MRAKVGVIQRALQREALRGRHGTAIHLSSGDGLA